ncbi:hypothetical protein HMPREF1624_00732 [Sporothrix schenckii ATCC 58251]|uniref:Uncharacterized protein n=1 Tax=Sporothrix schenckii (strain ATCC 58251 / de Perez 2211183) TaxID=1391915 RepID=U7Q3I9_SPOS1|nr:hypothetical protein HMPREF1624_00732 [Sporothrix schenckii ATCC 58251]
MPNKVTAVNRRAPGGAIAAAVQTIAKPEGGSVGEKTSCIQCDGYECCCIPIPLVCFNGSSARVVFFVPNAK